MRIAFLTPEYVRDGKPEGGLANYLYKLCPLLQARGHEPVVFLLGENLDDYEVEGVRVIETPGAPEPVWWIPSRFWFLQRPFQDRRQARLVSDRFLAEHARKPFDLVQAASYKGLATGLFKGVTSMEKRVSVPLVTRISSHTPLVRAAGGQPKSLVGHLCDWLELEQIICSDAVFAPSRFLQDYLRRFESTEAELVCTPFTSYQGPVDENLRNSLVGDNPYLVFFGALCMVKGVDLLADALPSVLDQYSDLRVVFIGRDCPLPNHNVQAVAYIEKTLKRFSDRVYCLDAQPQASLVPFVRDAHLVVLPSRVDNYPNTCLEAQAFGKIVVASRDSSLDEMVVDGDTGFLAERENSDSLRDAMCRALALSDEERAVMQENVRALAEERNVDGAVDDLIALYERTIKKCK